MNISRAFIVAGVATALVGSTLLSSQVLAWHPVGQITKSVTNTTSGSVESDANSAESAVTAKPGDIITYTIVIKNSGQPDAKGYNDLAFVKLTDTLPAGVELVGSPSERTITETIPGTIAPSKSVIKTYQVKVMSKTDGDVIKNTACFTGNSTAKDNSQQGCDDAYIKVEVPAPTPTPTPEPTPTPTPELPELPHTGLGATLGSIFGFSVLSAAAFGFVRSVRSSKHV